MISKLFVFHAVILMAGGVFVFGTDDVKRDPSSNQAQHDDYHFMKY